MPHQTAMLAGEAAVDGEILGWVLQNATGRLRPSAIPPGGNYSDTWFETYRRPSARMRSFPSAHAIAAFSIATVFARRYPDHRWVPWVAYGAATLVGFSRVTLQAHFPSDVFAGAAFGYLISRFIVMPGREPEAVGLPLDDPPISQSLNGPMNIMAGFCYGVHPHRTERRAGILSAFGNFFRKESCIDFFMQTKAAASSFFVRAGHGFLMAAILLPARPAAAVEWSTLFTAQDVRDHLSTEQGRQEALEFCRKMGITKVYIESFRDGYQAEEATLKAARDFFRQAGLKVSGCVTTTGIGKPSTGWQIAVCYTHRQNQERLESIFRFTAALFDEIMIDDFFFTDCECSECAAAKGALSWQQYREKLMLQMSRERVLGPAHAVNPKVKVIIEIPPVVRPFPGARLCAGPGSGHLRPHLGGHGTP